MRIDIEFIGADAATTALARRIANEILRVATPIILDARDDEWIAQLTDGAAHAGESLVFQRDALDTNGVRSVVVRLDDVAPADGFWQPPTPAAETVKTAEQAFRESTVTRDIDGNIVAVSTRTIPVS